MRGSSDRSLKIAPATGSPQDSSTDRTDGERAGESCGAAQGSDGDGGNHSQGNARVGRGRKPLDLDISEAMEAAVRGDRGESTSISETLNPKP